MARPCKSAKILTDCSQTKDEISKRIANENKLRGKADKLKPPSHLNNEQKKLFKYIVNELEQADILGNLDVYILETCVIAIDRKREIDRLINEDITQAFDPQVIGAKKKYTDELFRCCNELSLSPQARAKLGNINIEAQKQNSDPLLKVLQGRKKE
ncbi:phage terminase small subunit P27 family [Clostridium saccharoperbutylacetonicum]|uniref:phage terminase small subunit P27 family n=1 Tax=Clostridium saccharoperbutylacetonicum TaxID=36745 RepID=UPI000983C6ED|nr:phage terminase small subunit P27 family [Clostridium saccharoperbutylacetonicum]AQR98125.1 phage terminase, small subunit [Clostridium saccharoperbutylacetonicum]NSB34018.1 P27 family predicted phage terminase small subunit [Clostridium saccharoperbutylacetonicum]